MIARLALVAGTLLVALSVAGCVGIEAPSDTPPATSEAAVHTASVTPSPTPAPTPTPGPTVTPTAAVQTPTTTPSPNPTSSALATEVVLPSPTVSASVCDLVTAADVTQVMGMQATRDDSGGDDPATDCTYLLADFSAVDISIDDGDLTSAKLLFGKTARDLVIAGLPAVSGVFVGQPMVLVQNGEQQLQVLGILLPENRRAAVAKLVHIATIAVGRWH